MELFLQVTVDGLVRGAVYALVAVGMTVMFGVMRIINFAHGDFLMVALYASFFLMTAAGDLPPAAVFVLVVLFMGLLGLLLYLVLSPIIDASELSHVMLTVGLSIVLQSSAQLLFTSNPKWLDAANWQVVHIGPVSLEQRHVLALAIVSCITIALYFLLNRTSYGRQLRAVSENSEMAGLVGIESRRIIMASVVLSTALLGVAGFVLLPLSNASPTVGVQFTLLAFVVIVIGGLGDIVGALIGAILVGLTQAYGAAYLSSNWGGILVYAMLFLVLVLRPRGVFGRGRVI